MKTNLILFILCTSCLFSQFTGNPKAKFQSLLMPGWGENTLGESKRAKSFFIRETILWICYISSKKNACLSFKNGKVKCLTLSNGEQLSAQTIISSMGYVETLRVCKPSLTKETEGEVGQISFIESQYVLDRLPKDLGLDTSIIL